MSSSRKLSYPCGSLRGVHSLDIRNEARRLFAEGWTKKGIADRLGVSRASVREWVSGTLLTDDPAIRAGRCPRCADPARPPDDQPTYAYLLGQYLGDGHLATTVRVPMLRIACAASYPDIMDEVERAMVVVLARSVHRVRAPGCFQVKSYSTHWPCLFPQHGPGPKHLRRIELADWQQHIVRRHPEALLRGLIHADGSRVMNTIKYRGRVYRYPRYFFSNESVDILRICGEALDRVGVEWRFTRRNCLSVARREGVARLDSFVGAKS